MWTELWLPFAISTLTAIIEMAIKNPEKKAKYWNSLRKVRDLLIMLIPVDETPVDVREAKRTLKVK